MTSDKKFEIRKILLAGVIPGIVAIIVAWMNLRPKSNSANNEFNSSLDTGIIINSGRDINQAAGNFIKADRDVIINNYGDTSNPKSTLKKDENQKVQPKTNSKVQSDSKGDTYNTSSVNQQGGVTAGRIENLNITVPEEHIPDEIYKNNFNLEIDTINKVIIVSPKVGKWESVFLGILNNEKENVLNQFSSKSGMMMNMQVWVSNICNFSVYGMKTEGIPATKNFFYLISYKKFPSMLFFGDYNRGVICVNL